MNKYACKIEKIKCILNYFKRVTTQMPRGIITFTRQSLNQFPNFEQAKTKFRKPIIRFDGTIEECKGALQVLCDFLYLKVD